MEPFDQLRAQGLRQGARSKLEIKHRRADLSDPLYSEILADLPSEEVSYLRVPWNR
jgi:hypothetical protein